MKTQPQSNHATSSQSFVRHDVPLSYKYTAVHIYSTPKPDQYNRHISQYHPQPPKVIQYAPIQGQNQISGNSVYGKSTNENHGEENVSEKYDVISTHLEPKQNSLHLEQHPNRLSYVPGYNIELLKAVNRHPGNNPVYRSYPNMPPNEKINKVRV